MDTQTTWAQQLDAAVDAHQSRMVEVRRHLHAYPEVSGEEVRTTQYLDEQLRQAGLTARRGPERRGLILDQPAESPSPRIAMRADIDALRIQDAKTVEYRSKVDGVMHACGHDGHAATVLGTALALQSAQRSGVLPWPVPWRAIFQPAEETCKGALQMVEAGALDGVDALLSQHMDPTREAGTIGVRSGAFTAACDGIEIDIIGRGGHAARPYQSLDPIAAAAQLISSLYIFVPRAVQTYEPVVVTIGQIMGGENSNVIPDRVSIRGTMRSVGGEVRPRTIDHIRQLARGVAEASGTRIDVNFVTGPPSVVNDPALTNLIRATAIDLLGPDRVQKIPRPSMGGEDFAYYLPHVAGSMYRLGCSPTPASAPPLHTPEFDIDERALSVGAKILARAVVEWSNPARQEKEPSA